jgi:AI-2 transport protein TqsA
VPGAITVTTRPRTPIDVRRRPTSAKPRTLWRRRTAGISTDRGVAAGMVGAEAPVMRVLVSLASLVLIVFAVRVASPVLGPLALAATLAIAFEPLTTWLQHKGLSRILAAGLTAIAILALVGGLAVLVAQAALDLSDTIGGNADALRVRADAALVWLDAHGLRSIADQLRGQDLGGEAGALARTAATGAIDFLQALLLVVLTTAFIQLDGPGLRAVLRRRARQTRRPQEGVDEGLAEIRRYVVVKGLISLTGGVCLGAWCALWGIEGAVVWGALAFLLNFLPIVGSLIAAVPPVVLGLIAGGPMTALGVAAGYVVANIVIDNIIEPRVMGRAVGLSPLVVLLGMLFWAFVLGPIGALLSVPLTLGLRTVLISSAELPWIEPLLSDRSTRQVA